MYATFPCMLYVSWHTYLTHDCMTKYLESTQLIHAGQNNVPQSVNSSRTQNLMTVAYRSIHLPLPVSPSPLPADESTPRFFVQLLLDPVNKL